MVKYLNYTLILLLCLCSGCWRSEEEVPDTATPSMSSAEFSCLYKMREIPPSENGAYGFYADNSVLLLYPGMTTATWRGRVINLPQPPLLNAAGLQIPVASVNSLPRDILNREKIKRIQTTVIIDAGHGGHDPGAIGGSLAEKDLTLDIALKVSAILRQNKVPFKLTRNSDDFLTLRQRCAVANTNPGAIFVSIHVNSSSSLNASGVETYYISPKITDESRAKMAVSRYVLGGPEGRYSKQGGYDKAHDLSARYRKDSERLAQNIQQMLSLQTKDRDRGVKSANYAVLRESFFGPGVLTEIGFISNPSIRQKFQTGSYKNKIATAIAMAIINYLSSCSG